MNSCYVYILTNKHRTVLYTGVTSDIINRLEEHKQGKYSGFTKRYNVNLLVYFEKFDYIDQAILREKQIKKFRRSKKLALIQSTNPTLTEFTLT